MDKDRIEGAGTQAKGKAKEAWGTVTGDTKTEAEAEGRVQNAAMRAERRRTRSPREGTHKE